MAALVRKSLPSTQSGEAALCDITTAWYYATHFSFLALSTTKMVAKLAS